MYQNALRLNLKHFLGRNRTSLLSSHFRMNTLLLPLTHVHLRFKDGKMFVHPGPKQTTDSWVCVDRKRAIPL